MVDFTGEEILKKKSKRKRKRKKIKGKGKLNNKFNFALESIPFQNKGITVKVGFGTEL